MPLRIAITTLGCKVNRCDGDALIARLGEAAVEVPFSGMADLYIINSCTVTATADRQSRQLVHRARRRNPRASVVLTGCMAAQGQARRGELDLDGIYSPSRHEELICYAKQLMRQRDSATHPPAGEGTFTERARPFLKIQDGCDNSCSYCIVTLIRGPSRSVDPMTIRAALEKFSARGFSEVVLTGIHMGGYGADLDPVLTLHSLVRQNLGVVHRLRLSSLDPLEVGPELVSLLATNNALCPHLHVPIQSGDPGILRAMQRPYEIQQVRDLLAEIRQRRQDLALGTDLITGFPGESEASFENTLELVQGSPLTHLHVFPFSIRPGTTAANLPGQIPGHISRARAALLRRAGQLKLAAFAAAQVGQIREVVVETHQPGQGLEGLTDNYLRIRLPGDPDLVGRLLPVEVVSASKGVLQGRVV